jgi:heat shock protein HslJ
LFEHNKQKFNVWKVKGENMVTKKFFWWMFLGVLLAAGAAACGPNGVIPGTGFDDGVVLDGTAWVLVDLRGENPIQGAEPTLSFDGGNAGGQTGCNSYGGDYQVGPGRSINFGELFQTEIYCMGPEGVMEQESDYMNALRQAAYYQITNNRLELQNQAGEKILIFERE